ncbi:ribonuclease E/G [Brevundimonas sp. SORGH_AS_0993]|uniref:ribonuclease E/G n=1 Tax=Brevundimonas sp. SORGH_AS_0993 TaxID=3041794 RepID=UPI00277E6F54|nr:ribonuclease E/G [Brevundimonas sp. SORGH_AS_0993]MDQ1153133.1 Ribonuclease G/E [Brevundimonas sp. SORGH_AS_0993]
MSAVEVFLDETPGETRGVVLRDGRCTHLLIQREDDPAETRLGARSIGRVVEINPGLRGAFVDLGGATPGFLPLKRQDRPIRGERLEVAVVAEPRRGKGATLRRLGSGEGPPRLLQAAPDVAERLRVLAPDVESITDLAAIDAGIEAEEEALSATHVFMSHGIDLALERTRALAAVDIDYAASGGRDPKQGRAAANREGLRQAARLIGLKRWGGLVVIDLVGDGQEAEAQMKAARAAFAHEPQAVFGPVSRFGLMQLSLPWREAPIEEVLRGADGAATVQTRALALVRALRRQMLSDTRAPRLVAYCHPEEARVAAPLAARLGPRAAVQVDPAAPAGRGRIQEP